MKLVEHIKGFFIGILLIGATIYVKTTYFSEYGFLDTPIPKEPVITFMFALVAGLVLYSWWCCGGDHEGDPVEVEGVKFTIGERGWYKGLQTQHQCNNSEHDEED